MPNFVIIGGIACAVESQTESWPESGPEATITFKVPWFDRYTVVNNLMGTATMSGTNVVRTPPMAYPRTTNPNLRCVSAGTIEGRGSFWVANDGMYDFDFAFIQASYAILPYQIDAGDPAAGHRDPSGLPYTQTRIRANAELFSPPSGSYYTVYDQKPVPQSSLAIVRTHAEISMTRVMMPAIPLLESMTYMQSVNAAPIKVGNRTFPRGTLLYGGMEIEPAGDPMGRLLFNVTYTILGNDDVEWNEVYKENDWRITNAKKDGTGDPIFKYTNFDNATLPQLLSGFPA